MDVAELEAINQRLHDLLAQPCGMPRLLATLGDLHKACSLLAGHIMAAGEALAEALRGTQKEKAPARGAQVQA
ncbi:hypothetical protein JL37_21270 [Achromobacter sp. RTa]|uniref:hypothetical protein n=1 Tax=Achromobacter sp. RTa TaxID=1532557 RepID=UPI00050E795A|nr:hypothetical protein [Achromobacter sp. RTa]KGD90472.1 hypothetical protein JL37_21270 [Achromobacter sp. RTa]